MAGPVTQIEIFNCVVLSLVVCASQCSILIIIQATKFQTSKLWTKENSDQQSSGFLRKVAYYKVWDLFTKPAKFRGFWPIETISNWSGVRGFTVYRQ